MTDYEIRASSTVAIATELNIPMLVTNRTRRTYGFIDDDRVVVTRPALMSEVQALRALRTGDAAPFLAAPVAGTGMPAGDMPAVRAGVGDDADGAREARGQAGHARGPISTRGLLARGRRGRESRRCGHVRRARPNPISCDKFVTAPQQEPPTT